MDYYSWDLARRALFGPAPKAAHLRAAIARLQAAAWTPHGMLEDVEHAVLKVGAYKVEELRDGGEDREGYLVESARNEMIDEKRRRERQAADAAARIKRIYGQLPKYYVVFEDPDTYGELIDMLTLKERAVVDGTLMRKTQTEMAKYLDCTQQNVSRLRRNAVAKLADADHPKLGELGELVDRMPCILGYFEGRPVTTVARRSYSHLGLGRRRRTRNDVPAASAK